MLTSRILLSKPSNLKSIFVVGAIALVVFCGPVVSSAEKKEAPKEDVAVKSTYFQEGQKLMEEKDFGGALEQFKKVLQRDKNSEAVHIAMAKCYEELELVTQAMESYEEVVRINPLNVEVHMKLGDLYRSRVRFDKAIEEYNNVIVLDSDRPEPYFALAQIYTADNQKEKAREFYDKHLKLKPDHGRSHYELGVLLYEKSIMPEAKDSGKLSDTALSHFRQAVKNDPSIEDAYVWLASLLAARGLTDEAMKVVQDGLNTAPGNIDLRIKMAEMLFLQGNIDDAMQNVVQALAMDQTNQDAIELRQRITERKEQLAAEAAAEAGE